MLSPLLIWWAFRYVVAVAIPPFSCGTSGHFVPKLYDFTHGHTKGLSLDK